MITDETKPQTFSLTTPLYYVNDVPHMGSAYTTMVADAIARFKRLKGSSVLFITGTDEHGQKIQRTAVERGLEPQQHCDQVVVSFKDLWQKLNIQYDRFSRTTSQRHEAIVKEFFQRVYDNNDIYLAQQQGWYCVACEEFKEKRELREDGSCPLHPNKKAEWRDEENYFFRLSKYQEALETLYEEHHDFIEPETRRNEILKFVNQGLQDFSISRVNVGWGFPVPVDVNHTIYVWFDALIGYMSALLAPDQEPTIENALSKWWPINLHLIGKDILRFHAVYWPAMLMSAKLPLPKKIFSHGFLTKNGQKMSKTLANTLNPFDLVNRYGSDAVRYYFLKEIECGRDGDFNETRFVNVLNADLANDLGNLLNRTLGMTRKYCEGVVPRVANLPLDCPLKTTGQDLGLRVTQAYETIKFNQVCEEIFSLIRASNKFIDEQAPWSLFKQGKQAEVETILAAVLESVRLSAYLLSPIIPNLSNKIYQQLGLSVDFNDGDHVHQNTPFTQHSQWGKIKVSQTLTKPQPIFVRLNLPEEEST